MLKKIQNVWNTVLKKKKITNTSNLYNIKNNFNFTNMISSSLVFFITSINKIKLKNIKIINKTEFILNYYKILIIIAFIIIFSFLFFIFFIF